VLSTGNLLLAKLLSVVLKMEELELEELEADRLGAAMADVAELYDIEVAEKTAAWVNLGMVATEVYGTRITAIMLNRNRKPIAVIPGGAGAVQSASPVN
jgi:hypothetical protein